MGKVSRPCRAWPRPAQLEPFPSNPIQSNPIGRARCNRKMVQIVRRRRSRRGRRRLLPAALQFRMRENLARACAVAHVA